MQCPDLCGDDVEILVGIHAERLHHAADRGHEALVRAMCGQPRDQLGDHRHGIAAEGRDRCVTGLAERGDRGRQRGLLSHLQRVNNATIDELEAHAATLVDRVIALEVGTLLEEPRHADLLHPVLLVGL